MKHLLRRGAALLSITVLAATLAACTGTSNNTTQSNKDSLKLGISQYVEHAALDASREGFLDRLAEAGYVEGENLTIDYQNAQNDQSNAMTIAQKFAADSSMDLILAIATPTAQALANQIEDIPILVTAVTDPADAGLVASNEAPGRNITGTSDLNPVKEQVELLLELVPDAKTVGILYASTEQNSVLQGELVMAELKTHGMEGVLYTTPSSNDLQSVIESSVGKVDAWYIPTDNLFASSMSTVRNVAVEAKIPVMIGEYNMMEAGALATVAIDYYSLGQMTAEMALEIIEDGADPATMPIQYQADPQIYVNEEFAAEIGLAIPESVLAKAADGQ